jgi:hypothetical protein
MHSPREVKLRSGNRDSRRRLEILLPTHLGHHIGVFPIDGIRILVFNGFGSRWTASIVRSLFISWFVILGNVARARGHSLARYDDLRTVVCFEFMFSRTPIEARRRIDVQDAMASATLRLLDHEAGLKLELSVVGLSSKLSSIEVMMAGWRRRNGDERRKRRKRAEGTG